MKIDRHISELLYDHDCVIVPSFGGFLASYQPSQFQANQFTFYPPSKKIAFNVFLKNNDGLLASFVADREKLTYTEALKNIERFRTETIRILNSGERIVIEDVGTLYYDMSKNLQFEPSKHNYLKDSFGLTPIQSPPVNREEKRKQTEHRIREAVVIRSSERPTRAGSFSKMASPKNIFNTLLLSGALLWFSFNVYLVTPHRANVSSLNPFSFSSSPANLPQADESSAAKKENLKSVSSPAQTQKAIDSLDKVLPDKQPPTRPTEQSLVQADNSLASASIPAHKNETVNVEAAIQGEKNFYVIAGAFREPGNAEKLVNALKQDGFTAAQIVNPTESFKKVCYFSFASRAEAMSALTQLHSNNKEGWILAK